jgi:hypothetical protein
MGSDFSPATEAKIRQIQDRKKEREAKRAEAAAKKQEQEQKSKEFYNKQDAGCTLFGSRLFYECRRF